MPAAFGGGGGNWQRKASPISTVTNLVDPATGSVQPSGLTGWTLQMSEEFGGAITVTDTPNGLLKLRSDGPTWKAWYPTGTGDNGNDHSNNTGTELEWYDLSRVSLVSGVLQFDAVNDGVHSGVGLPYTSGMIQCNPGWNYQRGFVEARIKSDGLDGSWPAFWIVASSYQWPPEVDIFENFGVPNQYKVSNFGNGASVFGNAVTADVTVYHTYGLKWTATQLVWYLDGAVVATENVTGSLPTEPMYIILNLAVRQTTFSAYSMQVDYVRGWQ